MELIERDALIQRIAAPVVKDEAGAPLSDYAL